MPSDVVPAQPGNQWQQVMLPEALKKNLAGKAIVGHSKSMDTFGVYGHPVAGASEKTAVKLEQIFLEVLQTEAGTVCPSFLCQERNG